MKLTCSLFDAPSLVAAWANFTKTGVGRNVGELPFWRRVFNALPDDCNGVIMRVRFLLQIVTRNCGMSVELAIEQYLYQRKSY